MKKLKPNTTSELHILLLSPYHAASHRYWADSLMQNVVAKWTTLYLPARHFSWRIRSNSLTWAFSNKLALSQDFDLIIATSMTDLNGLFGFLPKLASVPSVLYFHENQFAYPTSSHAKPNIEPQLVPIYAALSATVLCFNTQYNYETFLQGTKDLLSRLPDGVPNDLIAQLENKSTILPVPIELSQFEFKETALPASLTDTPVHKEPKLKIVWNHRWEYDKWPEVFFSALHILEQHDISFDLYVLGLAFSERPAIFEQAKRQFAHCTKHWGAVDDKKAYYKILTECDIVVSTALHDFQGLAVMEATALGCVPVVPNRLAYQEIFAEKFCYKSCVDDEKKQAYYLATHLLDLHRNWDKRSVPNLQRFSWDSLANDYIALINNTIASKNKIK